MTLLVVYVLLALGVSFMCSIMEAVLLSVTPSFVAVAEQEGEAFAPKLRELKDDIDRPLAAILSLNTIAHTVGAAGAGAQAAVVFGDAMIGIFSGVLTLAILIFSEIIPKTLGALYWRDLAPVVTRILQPTILSMWPLVKMSQGITYLLARGHEPAGVSREEITALAEVGGEEGVFEEDELRILKNLFRFSSLRVRDVMTPRIVLFALPEATPAGDVLETYHDIRFTRIPVFGENRDNITGYVLKPEVVLEAAQGAEKTPLQKLRRELLVVPESLMLPELLEQFLDRREHIALAVDEYGGTGGVVTMEDLVETLLGLEIVDEVDSVEDMQELARQQWLRRARRLGIVPEDLEQLDAEEDALIRLGLTGGPPPQSTPHRRKDDDGA